MTVLTLFMKKKFNRRELSEFYFWRTYDGQEIDLIEVNAGEPEAFEIKWKSKKTKIPGAWQKAYPEASFTIISTENYLNWVL